MENSIMISLSKRKALLSLLGALAFMILGCLGAIKPNSLASPIMRSPEIIRILGIASIVFFGFCLVFITRKLFDPKPGLIIDQDGITDNTNASSVGFVEWNDIAGMECKQVMSTKFLILHTNKPDKYMQRVKGVAMKRVAEINYKTYGSPITIISNSLNMNFDDLEELIRAEFRKRKEPKL